jgi:Hom_end-associated Hint/Homing endonuclease
VGGDLLMGDDGTPRVVVGGSLCRGRGLMYLITPHWDGATPFTVNGDHILVLRHCVRPWKCWAESGGWKVCWYDINTDNEIVQRSAVCKSESDAEDERRDRQQLWAPLEWEVSVDQFRAAPAHIQRVCNLFQSGPVTFQSPQQPRLQHTLSLILGVQASAAQVEWAAWYLGMWMTDGVSRSHWMRLCRPHHSNCDIMARVMDYQVLFGDEVWQEIHQVSGAGHPVYYFSFGRQGEDDKLSIAHRLLKAYGLVDNKHIPQAWICDTVDVRRRILSGIIDGGGWYDVRDNMYSIACKQHRVATGCKVLAGSLGIRNGKIGNKACTNSQTAQPYNTYRVLLTGNMWDVVRYCADTHKRCPQPTTADNGVEKKAEDKTGFGFTITPLPVNDYYGFAVQGNNRRFILHDFTVTHNVATHSTETHAPQAHSNSSLSCAAWSHRHYRHLLPC